MQFRVLGPLEVMNVGRLVALGGAKQRATLALLLLNVNRVVATSELIDALWSESNIPVTARKILQNAVWGLRSALSDGPAGAESAALLTQAPGYILQVDPDQVDLHLFRRRVKEGRAELAANAPAEAAATLRDALALWRGAALADLVETGIVWPQLVAAQNARLDAMEDYFEAELRCGHHHSVLGTLEAVVEAEPLRERVCGQLMLALYRSGRQASALNVYSQARSALIEELGLEPGRELQLLQRAILNQDPVLSVGEDTAPAASLVARPYLQLDGESGPVATRQLEAPQPELVVPVESRLSGVLSVASGGQPTEWQQLPARREIVSTVLIRTEFGFGAEDLNLENIGEIRESASARIRELVEGLGGIIVASIGSVTFAVFGAEGSSADDAERAVRAATAIRGDLNAPGGSVPRASLIRRGLVTCAAVTTGEVLVRTKPAEGGTVPVVDGALLDQCQSLSSLVPLGEIWTCDRTYQVTRSTIAYTSVNDFPARWQVKEVRWGHERFHAAPILDRELELDLLRGLLECVRHRKTPHLVTVLGECSSGKTQLITEFERRVLGQPTTNRLLVGQVSLLDGTYSIQSVLSSYCGIQQYDSAESARTKLSAAVHREIGSEEQARRILAGLESLVDPKHTAAQRVGTDESTDAAREFLRETAMRHPLVMTLDDLHRADDALLDFIGDIAGDLGPVPLLVIAAARPELLDRRPAWGGGLNRFTVITISESLDIVAA